MAFFGKMAMKNHIVTPYPIASGKQEITCRYWKNEKNKNTPLIQQASTESCRPAVLDHTALKIIKIGSVFAMRQ
jgi:hypothetical protein